VSENLELVATGELIDELLRRHEYAVLGAMRTEPRTERFAVRWRWIGNAHTCAGMCMDLVGKIVDSIEEVQGECDLGEADDGH